MAFQSLRSALFVAALLLAAPALARDPVALAGAGRTLDLSVAALRALEPQTREVAFLTSKGEETGRYTGAKLWDIPAGNGLIDPAAHGALLRTLTIATLIGVEGGVLAVRGLDCLDGTPLLDLKPERSLFTPSPRNSRATGKWGVDILILLEESRKLQIRGKQTKCALHTFPSLNKECSSALS